MLKCMAPSSHGGSREFILFTAGRFLPSYFPLSKTSENGEPIVNQIRICGPWDTRERSDFSPALIPISTEPRKATMHYKGTGSATRLSPSLDVLNHPVVEVQRIGQSSAGAHTDQTARPPRKSRWEGAPNKPKEHSPIPNRWFWTSKRRNMEFEMVILVAQIVDQTVGLTK